AGPGLHVAASLPAELRLTARRLLGDQRVRGRRARVDLVVDEVQQLQDVHVADRDRLLVGRAALAVEEAHLARATAAGRLLGIDDELDRRVGVLLDPLHQRLVDVLFAGAVEDRSRDRLRLAVVTVFAED